MDTGKDVELDELPREATFCHDLLFCALLTAVSYELRISTHPSQKRNMTSKLGLLRLRVRLPVASRVWRDWM